MPDCFCDGIVILPPSQEALFVYNREPARDFSLYLKEQGWNNSLRRPVHCGGLIGNNKPDAAATVEAMLADLPALPEISDADRDLGQIEALLRRRNVDHVTYQDWKQLDRYEVARGAEQGCPRVKATTTSEMMAIIHQAREDSLVTSTAVSSLSGPSDSSVGRD